MKWKLIIKKWEKDFLFKYPKSVKNLFIWRTSKLDKKLQNEYQEEFVEHKLLPTIQNYLPFNSHILKSNNKNVIDFKNLSGDTHLVIPMPRKKKNYANFKYFLDNASKRQQKIFWKHTTKIIKQNLETHDILWISTHGFGVPYFHLRISIKPKYYGNSSLL